jgi:hypothetical protein
MTDPTAGYLDPVETGLRAWINGDLGTLETLLDPDVRFEWAEAGGLDCVDRRQVMQALHRPEPPPSPDE